MTLLTHGSLQAQVAQDLAELVASRAGCQDLVSALEVALGCRVWIGSSDETASEDTLSIPIAPGTEVLGYLRSDLPVWEADQERHLCLEYGARVLGIELFRERVALETRWNFEADLLTELLDAGERIPERLQQRAHHSGFDLQLPWSILVIESSETKTLPVELFAAARRPTVIGERAMTCLMKDQLIVAVCAHSADARDSKLRQLRQVARGLGISVRIGVSSTAPDLASGMRQALGALRIATCSAGANPTVYHQDLGILGFLLDTPDTTELVAWVSKCIGPLIAHDRQRDGELMHTLRIFLEEGGNGRRAAEQCHVHQSTIKYRMSRIRDLLGSDLTDAEVRFNLMLALKMHELLQTVDGDRAQPAVSSRLRIPTMSSQRFPGIEPAGTAVGELNAAPSEVQELASNVTRLANSSAAAAARGRSEPNVLSARSSVPAPTMGLGTAPRHGVAADLRADLG